MTDLQDRSNFEREREKLPIKPFLVALGFGLFAMACYVLQFGLGEGSAVFGVALVTAGMALVTGFLLGFLFGIPRTLQQDESPEPENSESQKPQGLKESSQSSPSAYGANTNLEEISDWLTKILVGVSLTQIGPITNSIQSLTKYLQPSLGDVKSSAGFALTILVYFSVVGFLIGFLWTRLTLPRQFANADQAVLQEITNVKQKTEDVKQKAEAHIRTLKDQGDNDFTATIALVQVLAPFQPDIPPEKLTKIFKEASPGTKVDIFKEAAQARIQLSLNDSSDNLNWLDILPGLINIFDSLIKTETGFMGKNLHLLYAELGIALTDLLYKDTDWKLLEDQDLQDLQNSDRAVDALDHAIQYRDQDTKSGPKSNRAYYEYRRAMARILDPSRANNDKGLIIADLKAAIECGYANKGNYKFMFDKPVNEWLEQHDVSLFD
jgi:cytoskeletal protein RodZ